MGSDPSLTPRYVLSAKCSPSWPSRNTVTPQRMPADMAARGVRLWRPFCGLATRLRTSLRTNTRKHARTHTSTHPHMHTSTHVGAGGRPPFVICAQDMAEDVDDDDSDVDQVRTDCTPDHTTWSPRCRPRPHAPTPLPSRLRASRSSNSPPLASRARPPFESRSFRLLREHSLSI